MKRIISILCTLFLISCSSTKSTDKLLEEVWAKDQNIRHQMIELTKSVTVDGRTELIDSLVNTSEKIELIDTENMAIVDSILQNGLPQELSKESYKTIWIVIDHSSLEKQVEYLPIVKQMSQNGLIDSDEYAILSDRIAMKQNRPQRYGTQSVQFGKTDDMQLYIWPIENTEDLDSLRASVGMRPMPEYLQLLTETTGIEVKYEPKISVDEINTMRANYKQ